MEILGKLEAPIEGAVVDTYPLQVFGWALATDGSDVDIEIAVNGKVLRHVEAALARVDVEAEHPQHETAYRSGFFASVDVQNVGTGSRTVDVTAISNGLRTSLVRVDIQLSDIRPGARDYVAWRPKWKKSGELFFRNVLIRKLGLQPNHRVLDVGCAIGRLALPLIDFLDRESGSYDGFDISPSAIEWNTRNVTSKHPNFTFTLADIYSAHYNPDGREMPETFRFPYPDETFDVVVLSSIFTHLVPDTALNYWQQIFRVLKPGGRCWGSIKLLNDETGRLIDAGKADFSYGIHDKGFRYTHEGRPEAALVLDEAQVMQQLEETGFEVVEIARGNWCGRDADGPKAQDAIIVAKPAFA